MLVYQRVLGGGFNPLEKYESKWIISPNRVENRKNIWNHHLVYTVYLEPETSISLISLMVLSNSRWFQTFGKRLVWSPCPSKKTDGLEFFQGSQHFAATSWFSTKNPWCCFLVCQGGKCMKWWNKSIGNRVFLLFMDCGYVKGHVREDSL